MVSAVVKVLETTTIKVVSGLRPFRARATSTGSTLAKKRRFLPFACACSPNSECKILELKLAALAAEAVAVCGDHANDAGNQMWPNLQTTGSIRVLRHTQPGQRVHKHIVGEEGPRTSSAAVCSVRRAVCTKRGPRKEPPIPMATTSVSGFPVAPSQVPLRTLSVKPLILSSTCQTSGTTSEPSVNICCRHTAAPSPG